MAILPNCVQRPHEKATVEKPEQIVEHKILAALRRAVFLSQAESNAALLEGRECVTDRLSQIPAGIRRSFLETTERAAHRSVPATPYAPDT